MRNIIINKTASFVAQKLSNETTGHDWWHIHRVWKLAKKIMKEEGGDEFIVELAALLHDISDWKQHDGDFNIGKREAEKWLVSIGVNNIVVDSICEIISSISFEGNHVANNSILSIEGKIVQDADRLDALGAIGIARAFYYAGSKGRLIFDPNIKPREYFNAKEYLLSDNSAINHFYEKILILKNRLNTNTAKVIAINRHQFVETYLDQFYNEWYGKDL
jgi:uncharacterized protein